MSGVLAVLGTPSVDRVTITLALVGSNRYGPNTGAQAVAMRAITLFYIDYDTATQTLRLLLTPDVVQSYFKRITVEDAAAGTFQTFTSATATYTDTGPDSQWTWSTASLWSAADIGETKLITLEY